MLPSELVLIICSYINKISDKRFFTRTCTKHYELTKNLLKEAVYRLNDRRCTNETKSKEIGLCFEPHKYYGPANIPYHKNCSLLEKYTLDLCNDGYFSLIPLHYYNENNKMMTLGLTLSGDLELLKFALGSNCPLHKDICIEAAKRGFLDIVHYSKENNCIIINVDSIASANGHLHIVKWFGTMYRLNVNEICRNAAFCGHLHILMWMKENYNISGTYVCEMAAKGGHLAVLEWVKTFQNGYALTSILYINAADNGHFDILKWLKEHNCPWDVKILERACASGNLEMIKWVHSQGCTIMTTACYTNAAYSGHLEVLKWLRTNNCPWTASVMLNAAIYGHLDVLEWVRTLVQPERVRTLVQPERVETTNNECLLPLELDIFGRSALYGHLHILKWVRTLVQSDRTRNNNYVLNASCYSNAAFGGHLNILKWLKENNYEFTCTSDIIDGAAQRGHLDVVKWLKFNGCEWSTRAFTSALSGCLI